MQLAAFIGVRAVQCVASEGVPTDAVNVWPEDGWNGALQGIPIYTCAFACHFNVLPVHGELAKPTRERLHRMVSKRLVPSPLTEVARRAVSSPGWGSGTPEPTLCVTPRAPKATAMGWKRYCDCDCLSK